MTNTLNKAFWSVLLIITFITLGESNLTEKQIKATGKLIRNNCKPKNKVTDAEIDAMHVGVWTDGNQNVKCYMLCALINVKVLNKDAQLDYKSVEPQINQLPVPRIAPTKASMEKCKEQVEFTDDKCDSAWRLAKCLYEDNPENYFLP